MKSGQRIQLAVENCVSFQFVLKKLEGYLAKKMRFPSNVLKEYNPLLKTVLDFILG